MKVLVVGDVHWSEYSSIIRKRGNKYSKRLENLINSLNWVEEQAEKLSVDIVLFLGDFFDKQSLNANELSALQEVVWSNKDHIFIVGNHEGLSEDLSISSAHLFKLIPNTRVIDKPELDIGFGYEFLYLPYCLEKNRKTISETLGPLYKKDVFVTQEVKLLYVFSHNDIKMQYGLLKSENGYDPEDIDRSCSLFLNGHLHNGGKFSEVGYNVGNLTGQNFSEDAEHYQHQICILDTDRETLTWEENPYAFNLYKFDVNTVEELNNKLNILKDNAVLTIKAPEQITSEVREILLKNNKVKDFRVVSIVGRESKQEEQKLESVNHLDEFVNFIRNNMEVTPKVIEELSYICK